MVTLLAVTSVLMLAAGTNLFSNAWMMLVDRENVIPAESSIFSFKPYEINQGSSNYWIYGEDDSNYYYFAHQPSVPYVVMSKGKDCQAFDRLDYTTWCGVRTGGK